MSGKGEEVLNNIREDAGKKQYGLKPLESQLLANVMNQHGNLLSNLLSVFAIERMAYTVTANTKFELAADLKSVKIWEGEPEAQGEGTLVEDGAKPEIVDGPPQVEDKQ